MTGAPDIDPGIRKTVALLLSLGFNTCDSGDGVSKSDCGVADERGVVENLDVPHVFMVVQPPERMIPEAQRLYIELGRVRRPHSETPHLRTVSVEASYNPAEHTAILMLWNFCDEMLPDADAEAVGSRNSGPRAKEVL